MGSTSNDASEDLSPHHTLALTDPRLILGVLPTCFDQDIQNLAGTIPFSVPPRFNKYKAVQEY